MAQNNRHYKDEFIKLYQFLDKKDEFTEKANFYLSEWTKFSETDFVRSSYKEKLTGFKDRFKADLKLEMQSNPLANTFYYISSDLQFSKNWHNLPFFDVSPQFDSEQKQWFFITPAYSANDALGKHFLVLLKLKRIPFRSFKLMILI